MAARAKAVPVAKRQKNPKSGKEKPSDQYSTHRAGMAAKSRERSKAGREIGPLLPDKLKKKKNACRQSLRLFCETYLSDRFFLGWSADHLKVIAKLEAAVLNGGLFALAMPRGSGKTTLAEAAALWAILYGHRSFIVLIGATDEAACEMLDSIKMAVETNDALFDSFHAVCQPIRELEGINHRAGGQTIDGIRTRITWTESEVVFPTVAGSAASGARIRVAGITGRIRGMKAATADGKVIRPDFAIADDPQTDQTAVSIPDIVKREKRLRGAVKGLAGPGKTIAMVVPCTVIAPRDLSDRILDRRRNPQFQGERMKMVYQFPAAKELWDQYADIRRAWFDADKIGDPHNDFYRKNRKVMDAGAVVAWPDRYDPDTEVSGIQAALNLWIDNPREFFAEYQNDPEEEELAAGAKMLNAEHVAGCLSGLPRFEVPREASRITAMIDAGGGVGRGLWYGVVAWDSDFGGTVLDYGTWPRQNRPLFSADDMRPGLAEAYPRLAATERLYAGLTDLAAEILGRTYFREASKEMLLVERCLIDCGWESATVYKFCRESKFANVIYPSKGVGRTTTARGVNEWKPRLGERRGHHWRLTVSETGRGRMVQFDPDAWKTSLFERLTTMPGGRGRLTLFGSSSGKPDHEMIAQHCAAESAEPATLRGATFDKWTVKPHKPDNHLWDCLVGTLVAASVQGLVWVPGGSTATKKKSPIDIEELYARSK
jgi:hypothetical protein